MLRRTSKIGVRPGVTARVEKDDHWEFLTLELTNLEKKKSIATMVQIGGITMLNTHIYSINVELFLRSTCAVARATIERVLKGILITSVPVHGPRNKHEPPLTPLELRYKVIGYADDSKPAITSMEEFITVDRSVTLFEKASGCKVHRDPANMKCKFLPLGRWRNTLHQEDIPCNYMTLSDHLDMVGVTLLASWPKTRKANGDALQQRVENNVRPWKGGKFMPVTINNFALSKVWFRARCVDLRVCGMKNITSNC